jgi:hypothetical protein
MSSILSLVTGFERFDRLEKSAVVNGFSPGLSGAVGWRVDGPALFYMSRL